MTDIVDRLRAAIDADIGIYPAAVAGFNDERDYVQRDGYKNGWNAATFELDKLHQRLHTDAADEIERLRCAIESAGKCLVMSNNGNAEALAILRATKHTDMKVEQ